MNLSDNSLVISKAIYSEEERPSIASIQLCTRVRYKKAASTNSAASISDLLQCTIDAMKAAYPEHPPEILHQLFRLNS